MPRNTPAGGHRCRGRCGATCAARTPRCRAALAAAAIAALLAAAPAPAQETPYAATSRGARCNLEKDGSLACRYVVGRDLEFVLRRVAEREVKLDIVRSDPDGDYVIEPALLGQCVMVRFGGNRTTVIPFSLDEVNLDFQVLGPSPGSPDDVQILLAAARKERVEDRVAAVEAAGLKALIMDVESYATQTAYEQIAHLLPGSGAGQTVAIIDVGSQNMHINILHDNESVYLREHGLGGNQLNNEISRRYGMSSEEAENAKRKGTLPESYDMEVLQPYSETLAMEIGRALQLFTVSAAETLAEDESTAAAAPVVTWTAT